MAGWEYKVVPAPTKGQKGQGVKGAEARFAFALETLMNEMAGDGWEFQRAETLPSVERSGLTGSTTEWRNLLVFRKPVQAPADAFEPELLPSPDMVDAPQDETEASDMTLQHEDEFAAGEEATQMAADNGGEETGPTPDTTTPLADQR